MSNPVDMPSTAAPEPIQAAERRAAAAITGWGALGVPTGGRARVWAVTSGKGGVGKTLVSVNLSAALAAQGQRVLVLDADLGLANLDVVLNLAPRTTLHDVLSGRAGLDSALIRVPGGFTVLPAGSGLIEYSRLTPDVRDSLRRVMESLTHRYDHIVLDSGAGISDVVLYTLSLADEVLIVTTPEPTALTDAYATIKVLATQQRRAAIDVIVNQTERSGQGKAVAAQLQQVVDRFVNPQVGAPVRLTHLGDIAQDPAVREAVQQRQLLLTSYPGSPAARAFAGLATQILKR